MVRNERHPENEMVVKFKCPKCSDLHLEEQMVGVIQESDVTHIASLSETDGECDNAVVEYGNASTSDGEVIQFQCRQCGKKIAETAEELYDWLNEHKMLEPMPPPTVTAKDVGASAAPNKIELAVLWDDNTWSTVIFDIPGAIDRTDYDAVNLWAIENVYGKADYRNIAMVTVHNTDPESDTDDPRLQETDDDES